MIKKILLIIFLLMAFISAFQSPYLLMFIIPLVAIVGVPYFDVFRSVKRNK